MALFDVKGHPCCRSLLSHMAYHIAYAVIQILHYQPQDVWYMSTFALYKTLMSGYLAFENS